MQIYARHSSLWYVIDAERTGPYRLSAKAAERNAPPIGITVYGGWASDTTRIVTGTDKVEFIAHAGGNFLVQVWSHEPWRIPARLVWDQHPHSPPENDDFADGQVLAGSSGSVKGTNYRATLEAFEFYGLRVDGATTWFTWTAPEAGWYQWRLLLNERPLRIAPDLHTLVFSGTDTHSLRRVSSIPSRGDNTHIPAELGKEYHIAVLDDGKRLISDYELRWSSRAQPLYTHFSNDMFDDAETIESTSGIRRLSIHKFRTVEPGEPELSGTGTAWWRWVAPADGRQVFRLDKARHEKLTLFTGTSVEDLEPVDDGAAVVADALQGESYSLSLGFRETSKFADLEYVTYEYATELHWGPVPKNDRPDEAEVLAGVSGSASGNHTYATTSDDEPNDIQGHSSLWWSWHASSTGWQRFELEGWNAEDIQGYVHPREPTRQQSILAVYRRTDSDDLELLATSDHSYVASGRMEATIRAREGENYLVRVALRATNLNPGWSRETAFTYATVPAPKWKRILPRVVEANPQPGDVEDDGLDRPRSLAVVGDPERVVVATRDNLAVYEDQPDGTVLTRTDTIPYTLEDGESVAVLDHAILHWNQPASELYLV
ncbi:MAG: hypothetical protein F4089_11830, partial [Gammaproteobacteria bacterium]|nr:hypothetical protein [Gammaproteobacteria bacterium]